MSIFTSRVVGPPGGPVHSEDGSEPRPGAASCSRPGPRPSGPPTAPRCRGASPDSPAVRLLVLSCEFPCPVLDSRALHSFEYGWFAFRRRCRGRRTPWAMGSSAAGACLRGKSTDRCDSVGETVGHRSVRTRLAAWWRCSAHGVLMSSHGYASVIGSDRNTCPRRRLRGGIMTVIRTVAVLTLGFSIGLGDDPLTGSAFALTRETRHGATLSFWTGGGGAVVLRWAGGSAVAGRRRADDDVRGRLRQGSAAWRGCRRVGLDDGTPLTACQSTASACRRADLPMGLTAHRVERGCSTLE